MKRNRGVEWLALAVALAIVPAAVRADEREETRSVSVIGTAIVRTVPDTIVWRVSTTDTDPDLLAAKAASDKKAKAILGLQGVLGIKPADMQSGHLNIEKVYQRDRQGNRQEFRHFQVTRTFTIRHKDTEKFDDVLTRLVGSGDVEVSFSFESSRFHTLRIETRQKALRIARDKAEAMTTALNARLGQVLKIEEHRPGYFESNPTSNASYYRGPEVPADEDTGTFAPGAIEIRVSVAVKFRIE